MCSVWQVYATQEAQFSRPPPFHYNTKYLVGGTLVFWADRNNMRKHRWLCQTPALLPQPTSEYRYTYDTYIHTQSFVRVSSLLLCVETIYRVVVPGNTIENAGGGVLLLAARCDPHLFSCTYICMRLPLLPAARTTSSLFFFSRFSILIFTFT